MKKTNSVGLILFFCYFLFFAVSFLEANPAGISNKDPHRIPTVTSKVKIDGILNEKVWEEALLLELNYEVEPGENIKPPVKTEVFLIYNPTHLYVAFRAYDPNPAQIRARVTDRDNIWEDDHVGIVLDTFNDTRRTFNFYCNPLGVQAEQVVGAKGGGSQWDAIWKSAGRINDEGYIVEMAIPFSSLRFQRQKADQTWRIDAIRSYPRNVVHLVGLFPRDRDNNCYMCQAREIIGFGGIRSGKNIELDPTLSAVLTQERESFPDGKFKKKASKLDPGLSAQWGFTPNLTLSLAINPDFSNVEADAYQLDINTQFSLFYPEKRPFFLESLSLFRTNFITIYTRNIADPNWGIKLAGKEGANAIAFFSVQDNITNFLFPGSQVSQTASRNMKNLSTVLRYRRDIGQLSTVGFVVTDREGGDYYSRLLGIDGDIWFSKKDRFSFQYYSSWTRYPEDLAVEFNQPDGVLKGSAANLSYRHNAEHIGLFVDYHRFTPNFRSDLGYMPQTDYTYIYTMGRYTLRRNPGHWYTTINFSASYQHEQQLNSNLLHEAGGFQLHYEGPLQSYITMDVNIGKKAYLDKLFDEDFFNFSAGIWPSGSLLLAIQGTFGDQVDYSNAQAGERLTLNPIIQYKMGRRFFLSFDHLFEKLDVEAGRLYTANLSNFRLVYQFNRRTFIRAILQYADFKYNSPLYSFPIDPKFQHLFSQVLFSYKVNPQTVLFLGYSDDYFSYSYVPSLRQNNRTFFLKIGYALVL
jgi:hypothetical protein